MPKKVIVIGLDGLEPTIVDAMLGAGELPNLARVRASGGSTRIRTTLPAQTPVAWSTFATGTNPGGHGIYDFIRRDPKTYLPDLGLNRYEQKSVMLPPKVVNLRRGAPVWTTLSEAGVPSVVMRCPCTYPPDSLRGRMLSGMGVPDLRGGLGTSTFYTSAAGVAPLESENVVQLAVEGGQPVQAYLIGPRNPKTGADCRANVSITVNHSERSVTIRSDGEPRELKVAEGQWSDWLRVKFKLGTLQSARGMMRFRLVSLAPELQLYASPINFDPNEPLFPISSPWEYASELGRQTGTYHTVGMVEDHTGLNNGRFDEHAYLQQCDQVIAEREAMLLYELERFKEGFLYCLFDTPDRIQHMFWRFREPDHPANREHPAADDFSHVIEDYYRRCDEVIGKVLQFADADTTLMVLSDHGFNSFQRGVHINSWLHDNGFLALKPGVERGEQAGDFFREVDWSRTQAYALGLGSIYLNQRGREANGVVNADEAGRVKQDIQRGLSGLVDEQRGRTAIRSVAAREQVYSGPFVDDAPDLVVNFEAGYRVSWSTALGGVPTGQFEDNTKRWGGDHIIDPALVPGVLFMNRPFSNGNTSLLDMAPTILSVFGVKAPPALEGHSVL